MTGTTFVARPPRRHNAPSPCVRPVWAGLLALACWALAPSPADAGDPATVLAHQKLSQTVGGLPAGIEPGKDFGRAATALGDVDGDGVVDVAVSAPNSDNGRGAVWILFLNADGTVKDSTLLGHQTNGFPGLFSFDILGSGLAGLGDLDGDGVPDLAVGARGDDEGGWASGAVYIVMLNGDGTAKSTTKLSNNAANISGINDNSWFGTSVADIGDIDDDGVTDIAVGAPEDREPGETWGRGAVWIVRLNADGTAKASQKISAVAGGFGGVLQCHGEFGMGLAGLGDLDGDDVGELAVGTRRNCDGCGNPCFDGQNTGAVWVLFLNPSGTVKTEQKIATGGIGGFDVLLEGYDFFGQNLVAVDDLDGDGIVDLAVGCPQDDDGGGSSTADRGAIYVLFLNADGTVHGQQKISDLEGGFTGTLSDVDRFGSSLAYLGDLDGNGHGDLFTGATGDDDGASNAGAGWVLFLDGARFKLLGHALAGVGGEMVLSATGELAGGDPVSLDVTGAPADAPAFLLISPAVANAHLFGGIVIPDTSLPMSVYPWTTDGAGEIHLTDTWPAEFDTGFQLYVQVWVADPSTPFGWAATQGLVMTQP